MCMSSKFNDSEGVNLFYRFERREWWWWRWWCAHALFEFDRGWWWWCYLLLCVSFVALVHFTTIGSRSAHTGRFETSTEWHGSLILQHITGGISASDQVSILEGYPGSLTLLVVQLNPLVLDFHVPHWRHPRKCFSGHIAYQWPAPISHSPGAWRCPPGLHCRNHHEDERWWNCYVLVGQMKISTLPTSAQKKETCEIGKGVFPPPTFTKTLST